VSRFGRVLCGGNPTRPAPLLWGPAGRPDSAGAAEVGGRRPGQGCGGPRDTPAQNRGLAAQGTGVGARPSPPQGLACCVALCYSNSVLA